MIQLNKYKKVCDLTDTEKNKVNDFFKQMFEVDRITNINIYIEGVKTVCEIEGFEKEISRVLGSVIKHDIEE